MQHHVLGLDMGSVSVAAAVVDPGGNAAGDHLQRLLGATLNRPEHPELFMAYGAAQAYLEATQDSGAVNAPTLEPAAAGGLFREETQKASEPHNVPPKLRRSMYPGSDGHSREEYTAADVTRHRYRINQY